jgi:hypothetical protein
MRIHMKIEIWDETETAYRGQARNRLEQSYEYEMPAKTMTELGTLFVDIDKIVQAFIK